MVDSSTCVCAASRPARGRRLREAGDAAAEPSGHHHGRGKRLRHHRAGAGALKQPTSTAAQAEPKQENKGKRHDEDIQGKECRNPRLRRRLAELPFRQTNRPRTASSAGANIDEGFGAPGVGAAIQRLPAAWSGRTSSRTSGSLPSFPRRRAPPPAASWRWRSAPSRTRCSTPRPRLLGVPCYELLGGKIRDRVRVYWSHCATWRINHPGWYKPAITDLDGVKAIGREVNEKNSPR